MAIQFGVYYKKEKVLVLVAVILFAVGAVVLSFILGQQNVTPLVLEPVRPPEPDIDWDVLSSTQLRNLQPLREIPALEGEAGRNNPFLPIGEEGEVENGTD